MVDMQKLLSSKFKKDQDAEEFNEKLQIKEEEIAINNDIKKKKEEIEAQKAKIADVFIRGNEKEGLLKNYIYKINKQMYDLKVDIGPYIEKNAKEIISSISEMQGLIKKSLEYTKKEMDKEIEIQFQEAEKRQMDKMNKQIAERNNKLKELYDLGNKRDQIKIDFEDTHFYLEKLKKINENLKIQYDNIRSENENLQNKLKDLGKQNANAEKELKEILKNKEEKENKDQSKQNNQNEEKYKEKYKDQENSKNEIENENELIVDFVDNRSNSNINNPLNSNFENSNININNDKEQFDLYNPKNIIAILKEYIKYMRSEIRELSQHCSEEKKKKNEVSQILEKCIDDLNIEIHKIDNSLPVIDKGPIKTNEKKEYLNKKLEILTYIFDNTLRDTKKKKLIVGNKLGMNTTKYSNNKSTFYGTFYK